MRKNYVWVSVVAVIAALVLLLTTTPRFGGDQNDYADRVASVMDGRSTAVPSLIEPGHLLWTPAIYLVSRTLPAAAGSSALDRALLAGRIVAVASAVLAAGALAVLVLACFGKVWLAVTAATLLLSIHGMLNYSQAGVSYVPSLAATCCSLALLLPARQRGSASLAMAAGVMAGVAVLFWLPLVLVLPAVFCSARLLAPSQPARPAPYLVWSVAACALTGGLAYGSAAVLAGIAPSDFLGWLQGAGHSIEGSGGVPRVVLGVARSFVYLGTDPGVVKRYLAGDPFYPVGLRELVMMPIWARLAVFYGAVSAVVVLAALRQRGRPSLLLLVGAAIPCLAFGLFWQGGDVERYLPIYPFAILCACAALAGVKPRATLRVVLVALTVMAVNNVYSLARPGVRAEQAAIAGRAECSGMGSGSVLVIPNWHDPLVNVYRTARTDGVLPDGVRVMAAVTPMGGGAEYWPSHVATRILHEHEAGHAVWIAKRALASRPAPASGWLEGEDRRLHWREIPAFFGTLTTEEVCQTADGFVLLKMDDRTRHILEARARMSASASRAQPSL